MQYFLVQCGLTILFTLLRWVFIWTKTTDGNVSWPIVNNLFFVIVLSWLFTLGFFVKHRLEENLKVQLEREKRNVRNSEYNYQEIKRQLNSKIDELKEEKERFFTMAENMVAAASEKRPFFSASRSDFEVVEKERATMSNFV